LVAVLLDRGNLVNPPRVVGQFSLRHLNGIIPIENLLTCVFDVKRKFIFYDLSSIFLLPLRLAHRVSWCLYLKGHKLINLCFFDRHIKGQKMILFGKILKAKVASAMPPESYKKPKLLF
tara:strand:- start:2457 stop:2813 length:357 start_codon:yes stop_codon:yes gene_type:complete